MGPWLFDYIQFFLLILRIFRYRLNSWQFFMTFLGLISDPFKGESWPPTMGSNGHCESPGKQHFVWLNHYPFRKTLLRPFQVRELLFHDTLLAAIPLGVRVYLTQFDKPARIQVGTDMAHVANTASAKGTEQNKMTKQEKYYFPEN